MKKWELHRKFKAIVLNSKFTFFTGVFCLTTSIHAQNWEQLVKLTAGDRAAMSRFGHSVDISGDYAVVGAPFSGNDENGGNFLDQAGAAYILHNNSGTWSVVQKIVASDRAQYDFFGGSVAIDDDYIVVGANMESHDETGGNLQNRAGSAYIFRNNGGTWSQVQKIVASDRAADDFFGYSVSIDDDYILVGAYGEDHNVAGVSMMSKSGSAYIFKNNSGTWSQVQKIVASDRAADDQFGYAVSISKDKLIVGAYTEDHDVTGGNALQGAGSAYIFVDNAGTWTEQQKIVASDRGFDDNFGYSVAINNTTVVVGAFKESEDATGGNTMQNSGSAYVFDYQSGTWSQTQKIVASDRDAMDYFGASVDLSDNYIVVGAYSETEDEQGQDSLFMAGSAYIFKNESGVWQQEQKIVAADRTADDYYGFDVAITNNFVLVGAARDSENATGGSPLNQAGSVYLYRIACTTDNTVSVSGGTITANLAGATYQWIDCNSNTPVAGETSQSFTPTITGDYAVEVTANGCTTTSVCTAISVVGLDGLEQNGLSIYPNPNNGMFTITSESGLENTVIEVYSIVGTVVYTNAAITGNSLTIDLQNERSGVYFVKVNDRSVIKLVKNN
ncbi:MAG: T9SS type A sorting domain-containing protein [Crocinitomicaceae bacterium]|nr:T9SS type A sorting domain-containing protein [Crocinitomicaceae bacterium]NGF74252.1 T9SS type A sorting domain-containing protein [Fluviicola sp. SGL-29]